MRKLLAFVFVCMSFYSVLQAQSICGGSSYTIVPTSTLTNPSYTLNPGGFTPNTNGNFVVSPAITTSYTLASSSGTATASSVIIVTVNAQPSSAVTQTQSTCTNSNNAVNLGLTFSPATPPPAYTLSWTPIPSTVLSPQQFTATNLTPGPYSVVATAATGCTAVINFTVNPQPTPANFTVIPFGGIHSITCITSTVDLSASSSNSNITYTWSGASFTPVLSPSITLTSLQLGTFTVTGQDGVSGCSTTYTFVLGQNIAVPSSTLSTTSIPITCSQSVAPTLTATANPSVNVSHFIYAPTGGTFIATSYTTIYTNFSPGTYTHVVVNDVNGCFTTDHFTVTSSDDYPIYGVDSPNSFTLGCASKSVGIINIINAATTPVSGGPVSYTLLSPGSSSVLPATGPLTGPASYTNITTPGTWTVVVRDNTNLCDTRTPVSITQNIQGPNLNATVPLQVLDCNTKQVLLEAFSETPNVGYLWTFTTSGTPGNVAGTTITVNTNSIAPTATVINIYTLTITDNNNSCKSTSLIPMYQNTFPPTTSITGGSNFLTCNSNTIVLTNQSKTGIPLAAIFPTNQPVIGFLWEGPSPQEPLQVNSTYTAATVGIYTLTGKDLNNGCTSKGNFTITDNRVAPIITVTTGPVFIDCGDKGVTLAPTITNGVSGSSDLSYTWTPPPGAPIGVNGNITFLAGAPGTYSVRVLNTKNGCVSNGTMQATSGSLTAKFDADKLTGFAPLTVSFKNSSFSSNGTTNISAIYSYGNGTRSGSVSPTGSFIPVAISSTVSPEVTYTHPGTYTVTMFVTKGVCIDTAYQVIKVEVPSSLEVPNVFTPNNDGINDIYFLKAANISQINMVIYDRWGHIVYEIESDTGNVEWDGKNAQGLEAAEGVYFYLLKTVGKDGEERDQKGTINLYR